MTQADTRTVMIVGATSDIARAVAHTYAQNGANLQLAARNHSRLEDDAADIRLRYGAQVSLHELDILELETFDAFVDGLNPLPDVVICAVGALGDQASDEKDVTAQQHVMMTNYVGPACLMGAVAERFAMRRSGKIIGISSVSGDRGRARNYIYGSSKAGFTVYLDGLRQRLHRQSVKTLTVKAGFVKTRMTSHLSLPKTLTLTTDQVAWKIYRADMNDKMSMHSSLSWAIIMTVVKAIPNKIFLHTRF